MLAVAINHVLQQPLIDQLSLDNFSLFLRLINLFSRQSLDPLGGCYCCACISCHLAAMGRMLGCWEGTVQENSES